MSNRTRTKKIVAITAILIGSCIFGATLVNSVIYSPEGTNEAEDSIVLPPFLSDGGVSDKGGESVERAPFAEEVVPPKRLIIPGLGIDAAIEKVGVTPKGTMGTPSNFSNVAWYRYGAMPGQRGSAVIGGHVDNGLSLPGVFKHLGKIAIGSEIWLEREDGSRLRFKVTDVSTYANEDVPLQEIFNRSDDSYLRMITCSGRWDNVEETYDQRIVVTAVRTGL